MAELTSAQLMEEELQHSVMVSEEDGEFEADGAADSTGTDKAETVASSAEINVRADDDEPEDQDMDGEGESENLEDNVSSANRPSSDQNGSTQGSQDFENEDVDEDEDEDAEGEEDDGVYEQDAEGEDEDMTVQPATTRADGLDAQDDEDEDAEGEEDDEGVGAVKIKPGEDDEEEEEEDDDEASEESEADAHSASDDDSEEEEEEEEAWQENVENEEDDEEEDENAISNVCMYCKQDEENDPSEEFETFLACKGCGENSHQQCARENDAIDQSNGPEKWRCPECYEADSESALADDGDDAHGEGAGQEAGGEDDMSPTSRKSNGPRLGRELLPSQRANPDSHSVFNQLVLDEDPMDGSRVLRKRKTSSAEVDEEVVSLRKRRKNTADDMSRDEESDGEETPRPRSSRSLRLKAPGSASASASITKKTRTSLVVKATLNAAELKKITSQKPKGVLKSTNKANASRSSRPGTSRSSVHVGVPLTAPFVSTSFSQPFYSFFDKEADEHKGKPYGGILTEAEADTSKTLPTSEDRRRFDEAKQKAEEEWRERLLRMQEENELPVKKAKKASGPASQIECIEFGGWEIDTWYAAPYPEEYSRNRVLYICEFCLKYMNSDYVAWRHKLKCPAKHPPGDEIYRHGSVSVFEVDGRKNPVYCQNLCLLAKLFLGSKTLYYDVEPFLFYVLCEFDDLGYHFVGYFSKEKRASSQNNVSCILTLPIHQRKGYGNLLIDFSYLLTRVEQKTGSPEKPLSDMGLVSYRNYWRLILSRYLLKHVPEDKFEPKGLSIKQISDDTGLTPDDVISALEGLRCLVRDPQTAVYAFRVDLAYCQEYVAKWESKKYVTLNPAALTWTPYVMGRNNAANFELGPAITAMASAGDEEEPKAINGEATADNLVNGGAPAVEEVEQAGVKAELDADANVIESTEPNETSAHVNGLVNGDDQTQAGGQHDQNHIAGTDVAERAHSSAISKKADDEDWASAYKSIPPTRFVVYPPLSSRRIDRPRPTLAQVATPVVRTMSASRPRPRRSIGSGSARRASASKPKSSSSKRKSGGTGRGPGRWPKGTKKSDYGGADSGPGMPPGWLESRKHAQAASHLKKKSEGDDQAEDTVQVQTIAAANAVNGASHVAQGGEDVVMADGDGDDE